MTWHVKGKIYKLILDLAIQAPFRHGGQHLMYLPLNLLCRRPFSRLSAPSHNQGYDSSAISVGKLASRFLQSLTMSVLFGKSWTEFRTALNAFKATTTVKALRQKATLHSSRGTSCYHLCTCWKMAWKNTELPPCNDSEPARSLI